MKTAYSQPLGIEIPEKIITFFRKKAEVTSKKSAITGLTVCCIAFITTLNSLVNNIAAGF